MNNFQILKCLQTLSKIKLNNRTLEYIKYSQPKNHYSLVTKSNNGLILNVIIMFDSKSRVNIGLAGRPQCLDFDNIDKTQLYNIIFSAIFNS